jgi:hypothetical protein
LGALSGLGDGDLDGCAACDIDTGDVTFFFHTCLVCGLDLGGIGSSFIGSSGSLFSSHPLFRG